jgi:hypothetical protein
VFSTFGSLKYSNSKSKFFLHLFWDFKLNRFRM